MLIIGLIINNTKTLEDWAVKSHPHWRQNVAGPGKLSPVCTSHYTHLLCPWWRHRPTMHWTGRQTVRRDNVDAASTVIRVVGFSGQPRTTGRGAVGEDQLRGGGEVEGAAGSMTERLWPAAGCVRVQPVGVVLCHRHAVSLITCRRVTFMTRQQRVLSTAVTWS